MREQPTFADYSAALIGQRNDALNSVVNLAADLAAAEREIARLTGEVERLSEMVAAARGDVE